MIHLKSGKRNAKSGNGGDGCRLRAIGYRNSLSPISYLLSPARAAALALTLALTGAAQAQVTLAKWTFETSIPTTGGPLTPEQGSGSATSNTGGTFSNPAGWGSAESWSSNGWDVGEYFQFSASTTFIKIGFELRLNKDELNICSFKLMKNVFNVRNISN